ncbi:MAG: hypothetical protein HEQ32_05195 [Vampirovibrio sp.]
MPSFPSQILPNYAQGAMPNIPVFRFQGVPTLPSTQSSSWAPQTSFQPAPWMTSQNFGFQGFPYPNTSRPVAFSNAFNTPRFAVGEPNPSAPEGFQNPMLNDWGNPSTPVNTTPKTEATSAPSSPANTNVSANYLKSLMSNLNLTEQQSSSLSSCFIHAGLNSMVKATRDEDPNGWLMNKMTQAIQPNPQTGDFTFQWANGQKMTIRKSQLDEYRQSEYAGLPTSDLTIATELAWFTKYPDQKQAGGYAHDFYKELFGVDARYLKSSEEALTVAAQKGVVSTVSGYSNVGTFHAWTLDREASSWDLNNSDIKGGFKNLPQTQYQANVDLSDAQLRTAVLNDPDAYISYFKIPA